MAKQLSRRSENEKKVAAAEVSKDPARQAVRGENGRFISNQRVPEMLPTYLIAMQSNTLIYNDVDVEAFKREVRQQAARILDAMKDERFADAGIAYQQFLDQYDDCFEMPSTDALHGVKRRGIDLYAVLDHQGDRLAQELGIENQSNGETERRFNAVTEAHINLFFYMLILNLAIHNKIDNAQRQLRIKIGLLEERLKNLLYRYIYGDQQGKVGNNIPASSTLYGWILLQKNELNTARAIYKHDPAEKNGDFSLLHAEVMSLYADSQSYDRDTPYYIRQSAFSRRGLSDDRTRIALRVCFYLKQMAQIREYLDELTEGSEQDETEEATVDVRSLLVSSASPGATE